MIAKLQTISHTKNALLYCARGGEYLYSNQCLGGPLEIYNQIQIHEALNDKCEKKGFHIKIRFAPEDKGKLTIQNWLEIAKAYSAKIGFRDNPYVVYIHEEGTDKEHIHIVASRINARNIAVSNSYTNYKNLDFCRWVEKEYNLRKVERKLEKLKAKRHFTSEDKRLGLMKREVDKAIEKSQTIETMIEDLANKSITVKVGRGITFVDAKGVSFKGSQLGRNYSLKGIKYYFKRQTLQSEKTIVTKLGNAL